VTTGGVGLHQWSYFSTTEAVTWLRPIHPALRSIHPVMTKPTSSSTICLRQCHRTTSTRCSRPLARWTTVNWSATKLQVRVQLFSHHYYQQIQSNRGRLLKAYKLKRKLHKRDIILIHIVKQWRFWEKFTRARAEVRCRPGTKGMIFFKHYKL